MSNKTCPECGVEVPANAPQGLCPRCLANMGLSLFSSEEPSRHDVLIERTGVMIGRYKLLERIGEGGFGVVFMAEQVEPVQRQVAIKIVKAGMDSKEVIARFEAERQAIAMMDHPNIARALDVGQTETGRPFFVMELVRGVPITEYCDRTKLSTCHRLRLFIKVCQAVQHAHQKGVIHRDLKPSNVLVTEHDGEPVPKVIDFGVAKALGQKLTDKTLFTGFLRMIGTPAYMSPEQAAWSGTDIDTRADIYSLGVLLYELLTGVTPFDADAVRKAALDELRRMIQETEPPKPSTRLQMLGDKLTEIARRRDAEPAGLSRMIRGDLDWIVMKCLEKDRKRRYETANGLATDLTRHLENEPVVARPQSNLYRLRKLIRRHKIVFFAGSAISLSLLIGLLSTTWLFVKEQRALRVATRARQDADTAKEQATEKLYEAYLAQIRANRRSQRTGRYFDTIETLAKAVAMRPSTELRNEAIACMALEDFQLIALAVSNTPPAGAAVFDERLEFCARVDAKGNTSVQRIPDMQEVAVVPTSHLGVRWLHRFSPDQRYLAFHTDLASHCVWDLQQGRMALQNLPERSGMIFYPQEKAIIGQINADGAISLFHLETGKESRKPMSHSPGAFVVAVHASSGRLACMSGDRRSLAVVTLATGHVADQFQVGGPCEHTAWSDDGTLLATALSNGRIQVWDVGTTKLLSTLEAHDDVVLKVAFNHAGTLLASTSWDDTTRLWEAVSGKQLLRISGSSYQMQFGEGDRQLAYIVQGEKLGLLGVATHPAYRRFDQPQHGGRGGKLAISPDQRFAAVVVEGQVCLWDCRTGSEIAHANDAGCCSVFFEPGRKSIVTCSPRGMARWQLPDGRADREIRSMPREAFSNPVPLLYGSTTAAGTTIATVILNANKARVINLLEPEKSVTLGPHDGMRYISISADGRWVATGTWNGSGVVVWDARTGKVIATLPEPHHADVLFSPDNRWLATGGSEYHLWNTSNWTPGPAITLPENNPHIGAMAFSADSSLLAIAQRNGVVRLLEVNTGRSLAEFENPAHSAAKALAFGATSDELFVSDGLGQVHVWNLPLVRQQLRTMGLDWD